MQEFHQEIWRQVYLSADILDDMQDGDLEAEQAQVLVPLVTVRGLARCMALAGQTPNPVQVLDILARTLHGLVQAQAWDLRPEEATGIRLVTSLEGRSGATMAGMLEMLGLFSPVATLSQGTLGRLGHMVGAALQWRSDLDAAAEAGPGSPRWQLLARTLQGLGLTPPFSPGLMLATVRLRVAHLRGAMLETLTGEEPRVIREALDEAFAVALDLRLAERHLNRIS
ncbi:MAG: hypothetical protein FJY99_10740 [Candidatus Sericytochromatia bacterium]|nr:hypothetical protein [Candidatus Tanganyikabacteria bacterium]